MKEALKGRKRLCRWKKMLNYYGATKAQALFVFYSQPNGREQFCLDFSGESPDLDQMLSYALQSNVIMLRRVNMPNCLAVQSEAS